MKSMRVDAFYQFCTGKSEKDIGKIVEILLKLFPLTYGKYRIKVRIGDKVEVLLITNIDPWRVVTSITNIVEPYCEEFDFA